MVTKAELPETGCAVALLNALKRRACPLLPGERALWRPEIKSKGKTAADVIGEQADEIAAAGKAIKDATESLMSASQEFGQRLYEQAAADQAAAGDAEDDTPSDDDVVDAEIIDDDEQTS